MSDSTIKLAEIIKVMEDFAPLDLQESYDNAGLLVGNPDLEVTGAILCLDSIESVLDEAIASNCNLVIAHHPIVFSGLKKFNGKNYIERCVIKAIKNDIAIYASHTNLDNVLLGVNGKICDKLQLRNRRILSAKNSRLCKLVTFAPTDAADKVLNAMFAAGAGNIGNYDECSFSMMGQGTFRGNESSNPTLGAKGVRETTDEKRLEVLVDKSALGDVLSAMNGAHPYEEVAYDIYPLLNKNQDRGSGMIGEFADAMSANDFLQHLKSNMNCEVVRHTELLGNSIKKVAVCGGSGSFLLEDAIRAGAQAFVTADFKYHQFFDADGKIVIADIGHFETEQFTMELMSQILTEKFPTFGVRLTTVKTNPVNYF